MGRGVFCVFFYTFVNIKMIYTFLFLLYIFFVVKLGDIECFDVFRVWFLGFGVLVFFFWVFKVEEVGFLFLDVFVV